MPRFVLLFCIGYETQSGILMPDNQNTCGVQTVTLGLVLRHVFILVLAYNSSLLRECRQKKLRLPLGLRILWSKVWLHLRY